MDANQIAALATAIAGLLTSVATLIKVLQHDGIIKDTQTTSQQSADAIRHVANNADTLSAHIAALASAANAFAAASLQAQAKQQGPTGH